MAAVTGKISFTEEDGTQVYLPFGAWLLRMIKKEASNNAWKHWHGDSDKNLYLWDANEEQEPGKGFAHFRDKEHLHLIDKDDDVVISTKHPEAATLDGRGHWLSGKDVQHLTGNKAVQRGDSPVITICTKAEPPDEVIGWQKNMIQELRDAAENWLAAAAGYKSEQLAAFRQK